MTVRSLVTAFAAVMVAMLALPAVAQEGESVRIRGTIDAVNGDVVSMTTREGEKLDLQLGDDTAVNYAVALTLDEIDENDFIGAAAVEGEGGKLDAIEVLVFPEELRGFGEGHYPWDLTPESNMTNATVTALGEEGEGITVDVQYPDGTKQITITPDIPVWTMAPGDRSNLQPGLYAFVVATKMPDGTHNANLFIVEKDGVKPPN